MFLQFSKLKTFSQFLGYRLQITRVERGLSKKQVAEQVGCSHQLIEKIEKGEHIGGCKVEMLARICEILEIQLSDLLQLAEHDITKERLRRNARR